MTDDLDPHRFATHRATLSTGATLAYLREGVGGVPLLLVHGWPETRASGGATSSRSWPRASR